MSQASVTRYHPLARALHWLLALALVGNFALGLYMADLPFSPARLQYISWHKWAGVLVLAFSAARLLTRLMAPPPALPKAIESAMPAWQRMAHHATHHGLSALRFQTIRPPWFCQRPAALSLPRLRQDVQWIDGHAAGEITSQRQMAQLL